ncbi:hypothetical protein ACFQJD_09295 [Haloplanus sp. GCM10025708]
MSVRTPGGGGMGDPAARDAESIARDLRLGKVSADAVENAYGVDPDDL